MVDLRTSEEWNQVKLHKIMDPDGWDRSNFKWSWYEQRITEDEFEARVAKSTTILDWDKVGIIVPTRKVSVNPCTTIKLNG